MDRRPSEGVADVLWQLGDDLENMTRREALTACLRHIESNPEHELFGWFQEQGSIEKALQTLEGE